MQAASKRYLATIVCVATMGSTANAHHSTTAFYDSDRIGEVRGRVARVRWINPHLIIEVASIDESGVERIWKIEGASVNTLERQGMSAEAIAVGDEVRVVGAMSRRGRPELLGGVLYAEDGEQLVLSGAAIRLGLTGPGPSVEKLAATEAGAGSPSAGTAGIFRVWSRRVGDGYPEPPASGLPFTAAALAAQQAWSPFTDDAGLRCVPPGMPAVIVNPYPIEFVDRGDRILLRIEEWDTVRTIHMTDAAPPDAAPAPLGYSVGQWEGGALVVETTKISWPYYDDVGTPQTERMKIEERFTLSDDGARLDYVQTAFDPLSFTEPAVVTGYFWLEAGAEIKPFNCTVSD